MDIKGNLGNLMKQAQDMQKKMQQAQEELTSLRVTGKAGGDLVKITLNGRHDCVKVELNDSLMGDDKEMLEDLVAAAINDATRKIEKQSKEKISKLTEGIDLPSGFDADTN